MMKNIHFHGLNFSDQNKFCSQLEGEKVAPGKRYVCHIMTKSMLPPYLCSTIRYNSSWLQNAAASYGWFKMDRVTYGTTGRGRRKDKRGEAWGFRENVSNRQGDKFQPILSIFFPSLYVVPAECIQRDGGRRDMF